MGVAFGSQLLEARHGERQSTSLGIGYTVYSEASEVM
jgi:hypothetical protein